MDIAAMSMQMSMAQVQEAANISVMRKAMDMQETQMANLLQIGRASCRERV